MASKKIVRVVIDNPFLNITVNSDGTVKRDPEPRNPPNSDPSSNSSVLSKDIILNPAKKTWLRLYIPNTAAPPPPSAKLPLILYYHGGGFVFSHADSLPYDVFCQGMVQKLGAVVISLEYRLASEHRLPAAYDDAAEGFSWLRSSDDDWIAKYADLNNCYICGTSAGANLAYHAGLGLASAGGLEPVRVRGLVLHQPYFSGAKRTGSEERLAGDPLLPLCAIDQLFDLSLPKGAADHDHEYSNPMGNGGSEYLDEFRRLGWRVLVTGCYDDPLVDAGRECLKVLEGRGVECVGFFGDGYHAMEVFDPTMSGPLYDAIKDFMVI